MWTVDATELIKRLESLKDAKDPAVNVYKISCNSM